MTLGTSLGGQHEHSTASQRGAAMTYDWCFKCDSVHDLDGACESTPAWRLFREAYNPQCMTLTPAPLFHMHGLCALPLDEWIVAFQGVVTNPSKHKTFRAGFHVFPSLVDCIKYSRNMDERYLLCKVRVKCTRPKPRSRSTVLLAKQMYVSAYDWSMRRSLKSLTSARARGTVSL